MMILAISAVAIVFGAIGLALVAGHHKSEMRKIDQHAVNMEAMLDEHREHMRKIHLAHVERLRRLRP